MTKTINSLQDLGAAMGMKKKDVPAPQFTFKCASCGGLMTKVAENVAVCRNPVKDKDGKELPTVCGRTRIFPVKN